MKIRRNYQNETFKNINDPNETSENINIKLKLLKCNVPK